MGAAQTRILAVSLFFLFVFVSGFGLSFLPKPFNGMLMSVHKLTSLALTGYLVYVVVQFHRSGNFSGLEWAIWAIAGFSFLVAIVSGGMIAAAPTAPTAQTAAHRIAPLTAVIATAAAFCLFLLRGR
jgi:predicted cobalt transporter CbtA